MSSPYLDRFGQPMLRSSLVLFVDLLGSTAVMTSDDAATRLRGLRNLRMALDHASRYLRGPVAQGSFTASWAIKTFSDNIAVVAPTSDDELLVDVELLTEHVALFQLTLILKGFLCRGGLAYGEAFVDEEIIYGPALANAFDTEKDARWPRVVLHSSAEELFVSHQGFRYSEDSVPWGIRPDRDGESFVDYPSSTRERCPTPARYRPSSATAHESSNSFNRNMQIIG